MLTFGVPVGIEAWRYVWRQGIAPLLPTRGLEALLEALRTDDPRLLQSQTTMPPPLDCVSDWPVEGACAISYPFWKDGVEDTVAYVERMFAQACYECDRRCGAPAACRWFISWVDDTPRAEVFRDLLPEVEQELARRREVAA